MAKLTVDKDGRQCSVCNIYKKWSEFGRHKKGTMCHKSLCKKCTSIEGQISRYGCLLEDLDLDVRGKDSEKIMDYYHKEAYEAKKHYYVDFFRNKHKYCSFCGALKSIGDFDRFEKTNKYSSCIGRTCKDCKIHNIKQEKLRRSERVRNKKINEIRDRFVNRGLDLSNGFVYLFYSPLLDCFKIGKTVDSPHSYIKVKSYDYGLEFDLIAYVVCPVRSYDVEFYISTPFKDSKVDWVKPNGGSANELFKCDPKKVILKMFDVSINVHIEPNSFISYSDFKSIQPKKNIDRDVKMYRKIKKLDDGVLARRFLRGVRNMKMWVVDLNGYRFPCDCRMQKFSKTLVKRKDGYYFRIKGKRIYVCSKSYGDIDFVKDHIKSLYAIREESFVNGRYSDGVIDEIKEEIKRLFNR